MHIREIKEQDNAKVESIIKSSLESFELNVPGTAYFDSHLGTLTEYYATIEKGQYWVLVDENDEVYGGVGVEPFNEEAGMCELHKLYISPEAQGKGLGSQLIEVALEYAEANYKSCYIETSQELQVANWLYMKYDFQQLESPLKNSQYSAMDTWFLKEFK